MDPNPVNQLLAELDTVPLNTSLSRGLRVAQKLDDKSLEKWIRLESVGYYGSNPAMTDDVKVPEYRSVPGQRVNQYGQVMRVPEKLDFVNITRLRNPVVELEQLQGTNGWITCQDPSASEMIRQYMQVDVEFFQFTAVHLAGLLNEVKIRLSDQLVPLEAKSSAVDWAVPRNEGDIVELKPNFLGLGIDLRALWRRLSKG